MMDRDAREQTIDILRTIKADIIQQADIIPLHFVSDELSSIADRIDDLIYQCRSNDTTEKITVEEYIDFIETSLGQKLLSSQKDFIKRIWEIKPWRVKYEL